MFSIKASALTLGALVSLGLGALPPAVTAAPTIEAFDVATTTTQAGAPTDLTLDLEFKESALEPSMPETLVKTLEVDLPAGIVGNPTGATECPLVDFADYNTGCQSASQVGIITTEGGQNGSFPIYLIESNAADSTATIGFMAVMGYPVVMEVRPRGEGDFGLKTVANPTAQAELSRMTATLWGQPAHPSHDPDRVLPAWFGGGLAPPPTVALRNFMTNGTSCEAREPASVRVDSHDDPGNFAVATAQLPALTDCASLLFRVGGTIRPTNPAADSPTGLGVQLDVGAPASFTERSHSHVKKVEMALPEGIAISPAGAAGLAACSDEQLNLGRDAAAVCPAESRLGTVRITTPLLPEALVGTVRLRTPLPDQLFRLVLLANGPGVRMKITGEAVPDPVTGQIRVLFDNTPQQPFTKLEVSFDGGPQAALATPLHCGTHTTTSRVTGWSGATIDFADSFNISSAANGGPCPSAPAFSPSLQAGSSTAQAGAATRFAVNVARRDGEQLLSRIDVQMPPGMTARVSSVPLCSAAQGLAGSCGPASQIGTVATGAGSGPAPLYLPGRVYLTEGYDGAPYGMSIVVPAKVGPFDLGDVVVRARVLVDRNTAAIRVVSEALPTILKGVPLRIKDVRINIDRPDFMLNPTNCTPMSVGAAITSTDGAVATPSTPFGVSGCRALGFKPTMTASTSGKRWKGSGNSLSVKIAQPGGQANLGEVSVTLPEPIAARLETVNQACQYADWAAGNCAETTRAGYATAVTPILPDPLKAGVYLVRQPDGKGVLPDLRMTLRGSGLAIDLLGRVTINKSGQPVATFPAIPDVPISSFEMDLPQGKNALLDSSKDLCAAGELELEARMSGQNGARYVTDVPVAVTDCPPRVSKVKQTSKGLKVTVVNVGAGSLRVSGSGVRSAKRSIKRAKTATLTVKLNAANQQRVRSGKSAKVRLKVSFKPKGEKKAKRAKRTVTVRGKR